ncbi:MAG: 3'(2'),5'-bisphosphate nucleotidase CysQ [Candidatus Krumholzibacteriota bacterium]|nr:3'(2'),5'-bisphosphate nucleotidase CysQ [Candidatus Krumholzibacteriota bacterium]
MNDLKTDILIEIAAEAGNKIMEIYRSGDLMREKKSDNSPLTLADRTSHHIIKNLINKNFPAIPILSEEGVSIPFEKRKSWDKFWLIDPLDGTKEFIKGNGEFTVNIALIVKNRPEAGVIYAPALDTFYYTAEEGGAKKIENGKGPVSISVNKSNNKPLTAVTSRSHSSEEEKQILTGYNVAESIAVGSSLKFCMVAEGKAQIYYRGGPTMEWDTAAGQAVAEHAGAEVKGLSYNKEVLRNGPFLVTSIDLPVR